MDVAKAVEESAVKSLTAPTGAATFAKSSVKYHLKSWLKTSKLFNETIQKQNQLQLIHVTNVYHNYQGVGTRLT